MGELYEPYPRLPKNIRQIGERDQVLKLYVEDYVNTYLKRLRPKGGTDLRVGLLLGNVEMRGDIPYVFVDGALEMEGVAGDGETVSFTEEAFKKAYQDMEQMFPKRTVQGWFLCGTADCSLNPLNYWKQHGQYFTGKHQLMYLSSGPEGEESVYITSPDGFYRLKGYSIFYERNQMMQDYMVLRREAHRVEAEVDDKVIRDFKKRMDQRRTEAVQEKGTIHLLTGLCGVLTITVLAGGVAMFGNFQKMRRMESVIASVLPGAAVLEESGTADASEEYASGPGGAAAAKESGSKIVLETMSPYQPDQIEEETEPQETMETAASEAAALQEEIETSAADYRVYTVAPGETLYGICFKEYGNISRLAEILKINGLENENSIYAGQELLIP